MKLNIFVLSKMWIKRFKKKSSNSKIIFRFIFFQDISILNNFYVQCNLIIDANNFVLLNYKKTYTFNKKKSIHRLNLMFSMDNLK